LASEENGVSDRRARLSIDVTPENRRRLRSAALKREQTIREYVWEAVEARLHEDAPEATAVADALTARTDPVLAELWDNPKDAVYDTLEPRRRRPRSVRVR
jgi:hypothetical protein